MEPISDMERAFLCAIHAQPEEDTPRLVLADWWQENGQEDYAAFIREAVNAALEGELGPDAGNRFNHLWGDDAGPDGCEIFRVHRGLPRCTIRVWQCHQIAGTGPVDRVRQLLQDITLRCDLEVEVNLCATDICSRGRLWLDPAEMFAVELPDRVREVRIIFTSVRGVGAPRRDVCNTALEILAESAWAVTVPHRKLRVAKPPRR